MDKTICCSKGPSARRTWVSVNCGSDPFQGNRSICVVNSISPVMQRPRPRIQAHVCSFCRSLTRGK